VPGLIALVNVGRNPATNAEIKIPVPFPFDVRSVGVQHRLQPRFGQKPEEFEFAFRASAGTRGCAGERHEQRLVLASSAASWVGGGEYWMSFRRSGMSAIIATPAMKLPQPSRENNFE
jgi:hypothetical protein